MKKQFSAESNVFSSSIHSKVILSLGLDCWTSFEGRIELLNNFLKVATTLVDLLFIELVSHLSRVQQMSTLIYFVYSNHWRKDIFLLEIPL